MSNRTKTFSRIAAVIMTLCLLAGCLTACGGEVDLKITDMGNSIEAKAKVGDTVAQVLEANKITLGEKDEAVPAVTEKIAEDTKEILVKRYAKVTVVNGSEKKEVEIIGGTVNDAIKSSGFKTDGLTPDVDGNTYLTNGMTITLKSGGNTVKLTTADGKTKDVVTNAATVKDFLEEQKITLKENETISPKLTDKITNGMSIVIKAKDATNETAAAATEAAQQVATTAPADNNDDNSSDNNSSDDRGSDDRGSDDSGSDDSGSDDSGSGSGDDGGSDDGGSGDGGVYEVSRQDMPDCDGSGHGYYIVTYSDGSVQYEEY